MRGHAPIGSVQVCHNLHATKAVSLRPTGIKPALALALAPDQPGPPLAAALPDLPAHAKLHLTVLSLPHPVGKLRGDSIPVLGMDVAVQETGTPTDN
jgi:hypothetical protein